MAVGLRRMLDVAGVSLLADLSGALFWEEQRLLLVSDLHLEKGSSFAGRGVLLPPYDTAATLGRLASVIARHDPRMVMALGDSFHEPDAHERLASGDRPRAPAQVPARQAALEVASRDQLVLTGISPARERLGERGVVARIRANQSRLGGTSERRGKTSARHDRAEPHKATAEKALLHFVHTIHGEHWQPGYLTAVRPQALRRRLAPGLPFSVGLTRR